MKSLNTRQNLIKFVSHSQNLDQLELSLTFPVHICSHENMVVPDLKANSTAA